MRAAMTRRTLVNAHEAIDEVDSPTDGLEDGTLTIDSQTTGNIKGKPNTISIDVPISTNSCFSMIFQIFGVVQR